MSYVQSSARFLLLVALSLFAGGCGGDELEKMDLSGNATFDGQPIVYGSIAFTPDASEGHKGGPQGFAEIVDGKYNTAVKGEGIVPGPYKVRVTAFPSRPPAVAEGESVPPPPGPDPLFIGYTMEMDLQEPKQDIDVPAAAKGSNRFAPSQRIRGLVP